jgi:hypothetical protein
VRRMACRSCAPRHCLALWVLLAESGGILIERSGGLQWLLITYAHTYDTVILKVLGRRLSTKEYMAAIIEKTESEEHKAFVPRSGGVAE